jgi:GR25 family glycosyltransferase involved in LPS biosynthesis
VAAKFKKKLNANKYGLNIYIGKDEFLNDVVFDSNISNMIYGRNLKEGEKNCARGHKKLWTISAEKTQDWKIYLEDDAIIEEEFDYVIENLIEYITKTPTAIILGRSKTIKDNLWFENIKLPLHNKKYINNILVGKKKQNLFGTVGYMLNDAALKQLLQLNKVFWKADDWQLFENYGIEILHLQNPCVWEDFLEHESTTGNSKKIQHNLIGRSILREIYTALKNRIKTILL